MAGMDTKRNEQQGSKRGFQVAAYRLWQVRQQLGFARLPSSYEYAEVSELLPALALVLFKSMSPADQQHSLRVYRGLRARGCYEQDMLAAALLHDVGKAQGRVPFWTRPAIVLGKHLAPALLKKIVLSPDQLEQPYSAKWRRALSYAWWHAEVGARMAASAGLSAQAVLYIRTHHQPDGPAAELHVVDEVS